MKKQFKNRQEVFEYLRANLLKIGLEEMQRRVGEKFFDMDDVVEALYVAIVSGQNIILWGPGGFGKSEITIEFLKQASIPYSTIIGYEDMDVEALLGLPNMSKLLEESTYEIAFEKTSFRKPGILVLEEFLDVNPKTAIALKDILTSGGFRQGDNLIDSLISSIIICSNRSPYELSTDSSNTAFYRERFPIVVNVKWINYSAKRYEQLIRKIVGKEEYEEHKMTWEVLAELSYRTSKRQEPVSPRIVKYAISVLKNNNYDVKYLRLIDGLDTSVLANVIALCRARDENTRLLNLSVKINRYLEQVISKDSQSTRYIMDSIANIVNIQERLESFVTTDENSVSLISTMKAKCTQVSEALWSKLSEEGNYDSETIDKLFEV